MSALDFGDFEKFLDQYRRNLEHQAVLVNNVMALQVRVEELERKVYELSEGVKVGGLDER